MRLVEGRQGRVAVVVEDLEELVRLDGHQLACVGPDQLAICAALRHVANGPHVADVERHGSRETLGRAGACEGVLEDTARCVVALRWVCVDNHEEDSRVKKSMSLGRSWRRFQLVCILDWMLRGH